MAIRYRWQGSDVVIETVSGNYLYKISNARDAYHNGGDIVVVSAEMRNIRFTPNGTRKFE